MPSCNASLQTVTSLQKRHGLIVTLRCSFASFLAFSWTSCGLNPFAFASSMPLRTAAHGGNVAADERPGS